MEDDLLPANAAITYLVDDHLQSIDIAPNEKRKFQYTELLMDFVQKAEKASGICWRGNRLQEEADYKLHEAIELAHELISRLYCACYTKVDGKAERYSHDKRDYFSVKQPERYRTIWKHRDLETAFHVGFTSEKSCDIYRSEISKIVHTYLNQDLRSAKFEVLVVDALVASEIYEYGEGLKKNPSRLLNPQQDYLMELVDELKDYNAAQGNFEKIVKIWREKSVEKSLKKFLICVVFLYVVPIVIAWLAARYKFDVIAFLSAAFVGLLAARALLSWVQKGVRSIFQVPQAPQKTPFEKALELHRKMVLAYQELRAGASSSPQRVREVLAKVTDEGAVWEPEVFSILDAAIARSHGDWG